MSEVTMAQQGEDKLTPEQFEALHERLLAERQRLIGAYRVHVHAGQEIVPAGNEDSIDQATMEYDREAMFDISDSELRQLREVEAALERIADGTYGLCQHSGKPIPVARLYALPWARYRTEYQEMIEQGLLDPTA